MKRLLILFAVLLSLDCQAKEWTIYLIQHSHTDIGYTRPQAEILAEHLRYIDYAIDYCELTADYPEDARFRWTCESAWVAAEYLKSRPKSQIDRFKKCIKAGQIEVTAMCFNMAEIADLNSLRFSLESLRTVLDAGIKPSVAMQNDVNGMAWCFADFFPALGVRYLWMGEHEHKAYVPFDKPTVFRWESPSGNAMTAFRAEHYMTANFWGIETLDMARMERSVTEYLKSLDERNYPYDAIGIQYSGAYTDNAPPSVKVCDFIREWNGKHDSVKLRSALPHEFLDYVSEKYPQSIEPYRQAYPDWWTDGFCSAARETAVARNVQESVAAAQGLLSMAALAGLSVRPDACRKASDIHENLLFYDEHTFGASESVSDPMCWNSQIQWMGKASYVWTAQRQARMLQADGTSSLLPMVRRGETAMLTLFNSLAWERSGMADVFVDYEIIPRSSGIELVDDQGSRAYAQTLAYRNEGRLLRVYSPSVPSFGYRTYRILPGSESPDPKYPGTDASEISGRFFSIDSDPATGAIRSIIETSTGRQLVDQDSEWGFGTMISERLNDRWDLARRNAVGLTRQVPQEARIFLGNDGPLFSTLIVECPSPDSEDGKYRCEIRLYKKTPLIELVYSMRIRKNTAPSAMYVAFPFAGDRGNGLSFDVQGGIVSPGVNQIAGTSSAWNTAQNFVSVRDGSSQTVLGFRDTPLFLLGDLMEGQFQYTKTYNVPHVFSWITNNYWTTNFRADQEGEFTWSYSIQSADGVESADALRMSVSDRSEFVAAVTPAGSENGRPMSASLISFDNENVLPVVSSLTDEGTSVLFVLQSASSDDPHFSVLDINGKPLKFVYADALGRAVGKTLTRGVCPAGSLTIIRISCPKIKDKV